MHSELLSFRGAAEGPSGAAEHAGHHQL